MAKRPSVPPLPLDRALEALLWASLHRSRAAIRARRVVVNGAIVDDPARIVNPARDEIDVAGEPITKGASRHVAVLLHKPAGVPVEPSTDEIDLYDLLPERHGWFAPCGTLRRHDSGLVLLTTDPDHEDADTSRWGVLSTDVVASNADNDSVTRIRLGPFHLEDLAEGSWQRITGDAIGALDAMIEAGIDDRTPLDQVWEEIARAAREHE